jgi:hypothetical protein
MTAADLDLGINEHTDLTAANTAFSTLTGLIGAAPL